MFKRILAIRWMRAKSDISPDAHFQTDHLISDIGNRTIRGGAVTLVAQSAKFSLRMASTIILARLLTPEDFGLFAMVLTVTVFVSNFKDMGLSMATIQRASVNHRQINTLLWLNVAMGSVSILILVSIAPVISWLYGEPRLTAIIMVLSSAFVFGGLTVQHQAILRRQMRFVALSGIEVTAIFIGIVIAIVSARYGAGYWALVFMQLAIEAVTMIGVWVMCDWRPGLPGWAHGVRSLLGFGGNITGFNAINYLMRNLDKILIGRYFGSQQLGVYSKAYQLMLLPLTELNTPISFVVLPALSRLAGQPDQYRRAYLRTLEKVAMLTVPVMAFAAATSDWLVAAILGPQWTNASWIFMWLSIAGLHQPITNTTGWLFITQDRTHHMLQWGLVGGTIVITSFMIGIVWGPVGIAASYAMFGVFINAPVLYWFVGRSGPVSTKDIYVTIAPSVIAALITAATVLAIRISVDISDYNIGLPLTFVIATVAALSTYLCFPTGRAALRDSSNIFSILVKTKT